MAIRSTSLGGGGQRAGRTQFNHHGWSISFWKVLVYAVITGSCRVSGVSTVKPTIGKSKWCVACRQNHISSNWHGSEGKQICHAVYQKLARRRGHLQPGKSLLWQSILLPKADGRDSSGSLIAMLKDRHDSGGFLTATNMLVNAGFRGPRLVMAQSFIWLLYWQASMVCAASLMSSVAIACSWTSHERFAEVRSSLAALLQGLVVVPVGARVSK